MDWICCLVRFLHHNESRKFDVCLDLFILFSQLFTNFHGFIPSVCDSWGIDLRNVNYMVVPWALCCFNEWRFDSSVNVQSVNLAIIGATLLYWETGDWFSFGRWALSIWDSVSFGDLWGIIVCISFARILLVVSQDSLSESCLMFRKVRVFLRFRFLVSSR